jgi:hypothetical protein
MPKGGSGPSIPFIPLVTVAGLGYAGYFHFCFFSGHLFSATFSAFIENNINKYSIQFHLSSKGR